MSVHTPGPWEISHQNGDALPGFQGLVGVVGPEQTNSLGNKFTQYIAQYIRPENAHLIAAAPELLAACENALFLLKSMGFVGGTVDELEAVIKKAKENNGNT